MTVQELLIKEGFDNIMKALQKTHYTDSSIGSVAGYKEDEKDRLVTFLKRYKDDITVLYGIDKDVSGGELALQFIGISKTKIDDDE